MYCDVLIHIYKCFGKKGKVNILVLLLVVKKWYKGGNMLKLKSIKIPEEAYNDAKKLMKKLEKTRAIAGIYKVGLSTAVSFAIRNALEDIHKKEMLISAAGGWSDIDADKMIKDIYDSRTSGRDIKLD